MFVVVSFPGPTTLSVLNAVTFMSLVSTCKRFKNILGFFDTNSFFCFFSFCAKGFGRICEFSLQTKQLGQLSEGSSEKNKQVCFCDRLFLLGRKTKTEF